ncbi:ubiquitin-conjugating enzyme E2 1 [Trichinella spiralis]|uniref:ubiquitin-conjugating enzyme E2 1 n=1 Tax=Trichinella spiralis TaxID=6334 RepID=UPI0001EFD54F|nr:ubiquitin-conjugating enzyme E2 1 [Trichinella spiralis]
MSSCKGIDIWLRTSPRISRFSVFLCFDKIAFTNSSDVTKDKGLYNTFIKLLEQSRILSNWRLNNHSRRNKLLRWDFEVHIRSRSSSTPIRPLSLYRPLRESHRPQGVDIDHFGYPCSRGIHQYLQRNIIHACQKLRRIINNVVISTSNCVAIIDWRIARK